MAKVAIVGAGLIGCSWATVFARGGFDVCLYDTDEKKLAAVPGSVRAMVDSLVRFGLLSGDPEAVLKRVSTSADLAHCVRDADMVQEAVLETVDAKKAVFKALDGLVGPDTLLASSTSGIPASSFTEDLDHRDHCLVGHPISPPFVIPLVEIIPAPWTDPKVVARALELYAQVGQEPILVKREVQGFIVNRLQGALLAEAFRLVEDGFATCADVDKAVKFGLGLRWAFMGPFETIDLNAPGGVTDYCHRYGPLYYDIASAAQARRWDDALLAKIEQERLAELPAAARPDRVVWRDERLAALVRHLKDANEQDK